MIKRWKNYVTRNQDIAVGLLFLSIILGMLGLMYMKSMGVI